MSNMPENVGQELEHTRSRRSLFKWMGQIAAGTALAGIGLGFTQSAAHAEPNCYKICGPCKILSCQLNGQCVHHGLGSYFIVYDWYSGCQPNCTTHQVSMCTVSCTC